MDYISKKNYFRVLNRQLRGVVKTTIKLIITITLYYGY